jgi:hypothetical protein
MAVFRVLLLLFLAAVCGLVIVYFVTGDRKYLRWAGRLFQWLVAAGLLFFVLMLAERMI